MVIIVSRVIFQVQNRKKKKTKKKKKKKKKTKKKKKNIATRVGTPTRAAQI